MTDTNPRDKLYDMIDEVEIAMLTTLEADGTLHTRPMANQKAERAGAIWFFTEKDGSVAGNVNGNPQVSLGYAASGTYVALSGKGKIVDYKAKIDQLWTEDVKAWFPKGKADPNLTLLCVEPEIGEYWSYPSALVSQAIGYVKARLTGQAADDIGENEKVSL